MPASWTSRGSVLIRLARQHFAFYRGYLDGLDVRLLAERYPGGEALGSDKESGPASGKGLLGWITQQLVTEAERCGQRSAARLLRLRPVQAAAAKQHETSPTLAEFQEQRDPYHMFSEGELLELFEMEYPARAGNADRIAQRNRRLRRRQEALLQLVESRIKLEPKLDDPVSAWIDAGLSRYLIKAHIMTLADLHATIEAHGFHWYRKVPRIGVKAARHITSWLLLPSTREGLGVTLSARGTIPPGQIPIGQIAPVAKGLGIFPLEQLCLPDSLSGLQGANRGATASIAVANDIEAIQAWLGQMKPGSHTARACRKEAERFLLWSVLEAGIPLSSVFTAEVQAYLDFLSQLGRQSPAEWALIRRIPQESWLGPRGIDRWSVRWRPFEGPLSIASQRTAISLLKSMMRFMHASGYLQDNPFVGVRVAVKRASDPGKEKGRRKALLQDEWIAAWNYLQGQAGSAPLLRVKVILLLLKETGCKLQQLAAMQGEALSGDEGCWRLRTSVEEGPDSTIQVSKELHDALLGTFRCHGFGELDRVPPSMPFVTELPTGSRSGVVPQGVSASRIYRIVKDFFEKVACNVQVIDPELASRLRQISADSFIFHD